jgi:hypothetical protein
MSSRLNLHILQFYETFSSFAFVACDCSSSDVAIIRVLCTRHTVLSGIALGHSSTIELDSMELPSANCVSLNIGTFEFLTVT